MKPLCIGPLYALGHLELSLFCGGLHATRDFVTQATLAYQYNDLKPEQDLAKRNWIDLAKQFWQSAHDDSEEANAKAPKLHRKKASEWLCATTHMLQICIGATWNLFKVEPSKTRLTLQTAPLVSREARPWRVRIFCLFPGQVATTNSFTPLVYCVALGDSCCSVLV